MELFDLTGESFMGDKRQNYEKGHRSEAAARKYLEGQGYEILDSNYRFHRNEVDIIAREGDCLVFLEVKARTSPLLGFGFQAVDWGKQQRIRRVAEEYLLRNHLDPWKTPCRFDIVSIDGGDFCLFKNAF